MRRRTRHPETHAVQPGVPRHDSENGVVARRPRFCYGGCSPYPSKERKTCGNGISITFKMGVEQVDGFVTTRRSGDGGIAGRLYFVDA